MTLAPDTFTFVADLVRRRSAIHLTAGKEYLVESRLLPLAHQAGIEGVDEYVNILRSAPQSPDHDRVVEALTTNETSWFRDVSPFHALTGHVVPALVRERPALTPVRLWSAACSTGQEPYSIAMSLLAAAPGLEVRITATDISEEVLSRGRTGRYTQLEINRGLPAAMLVRHFTRVGTAWELSAKLRSMVAFSRHNLLNTPPLGAPFDIVFLRNVLIYFDVETRREVLRRVRGAVRPGGFLLLGAVETTFGIDDMWERVPVDGGSVYRLKPWRAA